MINKVEISASADLLAFVLAKNEEQNIAKCLRCLVGHGARTIVLDSGSTDGTRAVVAEFAGAEVVPHDYTSHAETYNYITEVRTPSGQWVLILDADMEVSSSLWCELGSMMQSGRHDAIAAPIEMWIEGARLSCGSLCPPKLFAFRGGQRYFRPQGHGERLLGGVACGLTRNPIVHNDLKPYERYLESQVRYARNLWSRSKSGQLAVLDRISLCIPLKAYISPLLSLFIKGGLLAGTRGLLYSLDRHIAGLVQYREIIANRLSDKESP